MYVLPSSQGSTLDFGVLDSALKRECDRLIIPQGDYW